MVAILPGPVADLGLAIERQLKLALPPDIFDYDWLPAQLNKDVWDQVIRRCPGVKLQFAGFQHVERMSGLTGTCAFQVFTPVRNPRSARAALFGDGLSAGALQVAQAAMRMLHGFEPSKGGGSLVVVDCKMAVFEEREDPGVLVPAITVVLPQLGITAASVFGPADFLESAATGSVVMDWQFDGATLADLSLEAQ